MTPVEIKNKIDDILDDYWHCDTYTKVTAVDAIYEIFSESLEELKAENERLKGLLLKMYQRQFGDGWSKEAKDSLIQQFKTENNL